MTVDAAHTSQPEQQTVVERPLSARTPPPLPSSVSLLGPGKSPFNVERREAPGLSYRAVLLAASLLALNAGLVNSVCLVSKMGITVSHVSGTSTQLGLALVVGDENGKMLYGVLLLSFLSGATLCGFAMKASALMLGLSVYGTALLGVALLLVLSRAAGSTLAGVSLAACAMGLQNASFSVYTGESPHVLSRLL